MCFEIITIEIQIFYVDYNEGSTINFIQKKKKTK